MKKEVKKVKKVGGTKSAQPRIRPRPNIAPRPERVSPPMLTAPDHLSALSSSSGQSPA
jgi:hypothetical protein